MTNLLSTLMAVAVSATLSISQTVSPPQTSDLDLMARVIMSEAGGLEYTGKLGVAACIVNRVNSPDFPNTVEGVIRQPNQFWMGNNGAPTSECYQAAIEVLENNPFPADMFYFRINHPHSFGFEYMHVGNTYFNTRTNYDVLLEGVPDDMQ